MTPSKTGLGPLPGEHSQAQDLRTMALVGLAHGSSHFFHLLLPPLFPFFIRDFGLSYSDLGLLVTAFFVVSGTGQALAGFVVDRWGARPVLFGAMVCFALAALAASVATGWWSLLLAALLAGLGNAPFHPADFTILNQRISPSRLGHAFSVHGISGNLGWALAPVFYASLTLSLGSWRTAYLCAALLALTVLAVLVWHRDALNAPAHPRAAPAGAPGGHPAEPALAFLRLPAVWLCFSFFFWSTCALSAIQSFASPALQQIYGLPLSSTSLVVTGYMLFGAAGMVLGGFAVPRVQRIERIIAVALLIAAVLLFIVGAALVPAAWAAGVAALAGFATGLAGPSRDMLIRRAAPPGATGRVYGTVYSGLDLGFAVAAPVFGALLDHHQAGAVFHGAALTLVLGVVSAAWVGERIVRTRTLAAA